MDKAKYAKIIVPMLFVPILTAGFIIYRKAKRKYNQQPKTQSPILIPSKLIPKLFDRHDSEIYKDHTLNINVKKIVKQSENTILTIESNPIESTDTFEILPILPRFYFKQRDYLFKCWDLSSKVLLYTLTLKISTQDEYIDKYVYYDISAGLRIDSVATNYVGNLGEELWQMIHTDSATPFSFSVENIVTLKQNFSEKTNQIKKFKDLLLSFTLIPSSIFEQVLTFKCTNIIYTENHITIIPLISLIYSYLP